MKRKVGLINFMTSAEKFNELISLIEDSNYPVDMYIDWDGEDSAIFLHDLVIKNNRKYGFNVYFSNPTLPAGHPRRMVQILSRVGFDLLMSMASKWSMSEIETDYTEDIFDKADRLRADCI